MKIQKKWLYILLAAAGVFGVVTILFFSGEKWLRDGWYYIPDRAIAIALGLCVFWQIVLTAGTFFLLAWNRKKFDDWMRRIIRIPAEIAKGRGGGFSVPVFCMELVSLQSWI